MKILLMYFTALYFYQKFYFCYLFIFSRNNPSLSRIFLCASPFYLSDQMQVWLMILLLLLQELMGRPLCLKFSQKNDDVSESNKEEEDVSEDQSAES